MDGVLISSTACDERGWLNWARMHGMEGSFSLKSTHGRRAADTLRDLRPDLDPTVELARLEDLAVAEPEGIERLPGVREFLAALPERRWAVVTSASERVLKARLGFAGLEPPAFFVTAEKVRNGKPDPEPYALGAEILGVPAAECVVIEDAPSGIAAGKAAGCKVLALTTSHRADELGAADWIVGNLSDVQVDAEADGPLRLTLRMQG